jgi:putative ABC transport system ATP-binding protein
MAHKSPAIRVESVSKRYRRGHRDVLALDDLSLVVPRGEFLSIMGPSGSGKSSLLNLLAGLDTPTAGRIVVDDVPITGIGDDALTELRRTRLGIVFQFFNLLPSISALDNVALPLSAAGVAHTEAARRAQAALERVALADRRNHLPEELSGGEMQRVAIARALVIDPAIVLADEPTGNLDSWAGADILRLLRDYNRTQGVTIVLVTHSHTAAAYGDRLITLRDGKIVDDALTRPEKPAPHLRPVS